MQQKSDSVRLNRGCCRLINIHRVLRIEKCFNTKNKPKISLAIETKKMENGSCMKQTNMKYYLSQLYQTKHRKSKCCGLHQTM